MNPITTWQFSVSSQGAVNSYYSDFYYAGGVAVVGFGSGSGTSWQVFNLGNSQVALMTSKTDQDGKTHTYYWNSHYGTQSGGKNDGMMLWNDEDRYSSSSIGQEQTFTLVNLGGGNVAFQATGGAFANQYLGGETGGWYPEQWGLGNGSFLAASSTVPFQVTGDQLPILMITNSGYNLNLSGCSLGALSLSNADMRGCNLQNADLSQVTSLSGANFTGAKLSGANLAGLNLSGANWTQASFAQSNLTTLAGAQGAQLTGAVFQQAVLDGVDFTGADLSGADLTGASLKGTIFSSANLQGTLFNSCDLSTAQFDPVPNFTRASTGRTTFQGATVPFPVLNSNWSWLDLTGANITGIPTTIPSLVADGALLPDGLSLQGVDMSGASFQGTQMYEVQLQGANLQSANLSNALLKGAALNGTNLTLANLNNAWLIAEQTTDPGGTPVSQLEAAEASNAFMFNTVLDGAHCDGVDFSGALFVTASYISTSQQASAVGASMNLAKFNNASVVLAVFNGAQLSGSNFSGASMVGASFQDNGSQATELNPTSDAIHTGANLYQADIRGANFTGANMDGANLAEALCSTTNGEFIHQFSDYNGQPVVVAFQYGPTQLGNTTPNTTCPDNGKGPCTLCAAPTQLAS